MRHLPVRHARDASRHGSRNVRIAALVVLPADGIGAGDDVNGDFGTSPFWGRPSRASGAHV